MSNFESMTVSQWEDKFKPQSNHITKEEGCDYYDSHGPEGEYVKQFAIDHPDRVWTQFDGDDGQILIGNGYHYVNRIHYYITEKPCPDNMDIEATLDY